MNSWITRRKGRTTPVTQRIFCFPYAGGSSSIYRDWQNHVPDSFEICAVNLPGRGIRLTEKAYSEMSPLTDALLDALAPEMDVPFVFFGHSMGSMIAFELARKLRVCSLKLPHHLFLSGRSGPENPTRPSSSDRPISDEDLIEMLAHLNGTSQNILANQELITLTLPSLRADMTLVQSHLYDRQVPLPCGITVFGGEEDPTCTPKELLNWSLETNYSFRMFMFKGDHFFLNSHRTAILNRITKTITEKRN